MEEVLVSDKSPSPLQAAKSPSRENSHGEFSPKPAVKPKPIYGVVPAYCTKNGDKRDEDDGIGKIMKLLVRIIVLKI